jgi:hypothetical protein
MSEQAFLELALLRLESLTPTWFNDPVPGEKFRRMTRVAALPYKIGIAEI